MPFYNTANFRFTSIGVSIFAVVGLTLSALAELHLTNAHLVQDRVVERVIEMEKLPAKRGLIMDRNEQILTNNIETAELVADRYHLREINVVIEGLAYNAASHDPKWAQADEEERERIFRNKQEALLKNAKIEITQEERENNRRLRKEGKQGTDVNRESYKPEVCEQYYKQHDLLLAQLLHPFLRHERPNAKGDMIAGMSLQEIIDKIEQPEVTAQLAANPNSTASYRNHIVLAKDIPIDKGNEIRAALSKARIRGVVVQSDSYRSYVIPNMLSHVMGRLNYEKKGESGVELKFDNYLRGVDGLREFRRDARGKVVPHADDRYLAPEHGLNLRLTIDMRIQRIVEEELDKGLRVFRAKKGCMIILDPKTGDIIAMASRPSSNLNTREVITHNGTLPLDNTAGEKGEPLGGEYNFATQARYEPGSTIKVVAVTTAVDQGVMNINSLVSTSPFTGNGAFKSVNDGRWHYGPLPLWGVLKKSSNPGAARIAFACKWPVYNDYLKRFGLTESADICLPSGGGCIIADGTKLVNFSRIAYGYSISVSPLHMAMVYAAIANDGVRMKPRLIDKIISPDGSVFDECEPVVAQRVMKSSTARDLRAALHHVTIRESPKNHGNGTAMAAAIPGFDVGGKTGTAKKVTGKGGYHEGIYTVSFAGVFPIDNPRYVVMTVIDEPLSPDGRGIGGGTVPAPIFRRTMMRIIDTLQIQPKDPEAYKAFCAKQAESDAEFAKKCADYQKNKRTKR